MTEIRMNKFPKDLTLEITIVTTTEFKVRKAIAVFLIKLAVRILGCGVEIKGE